MVIYIIEGKKDGKEWTPLSSVIENEQARFWYSSRCLRTMFSDKQEATVQLKRLRLTEKEKLRLKEWRRT
jgi:hypothetical protein